MADSGRNLTSFVSWAHSDHLAENDRYVRFRAP